MVDSTAISIAAIATTGLATGVAGPLIVSRATSRGQMRKFRHERAIRDVAELRQLLDETSEAFNFMLRRFAGLDALINKVGVGKASEEALDELSDRIDQFEATASRLAMRLGPDGELTAICRRLIASVEEVQSDLYEADLLRRRLDEDRLTDEERKQTTVEEMKTVFNAVEKAGNLRQLQPAFVAAAYDVAGAATQE
ncbi:MAG TPA: hypothetical protein VNS60_13540 [Solirubrobacterales bacterium]|nr:hypothetical protein [Solirubrobacterales bacterium]